MYSQIRNISTACIVLVALGGFFQTATAQTETNKAVVFRLGEVWNQGNLAVADEIFATDFVNHDPSRPDVTDLESYKGAVVEYRTAFPDFRVVIHMVAEGDKVAARWTATGTHQGEFMGIPPTGKHMTWTGMNIFRLAGGKIVEAWWSYDALALMQQLGVMPPTRGDYTWGAFSGVTGHPGDPETNKALVQRMIDEVMNQQNLGVIDELFAADYLMHDPAWPTEVKGPEGFKQWAGAMLEPYFADSLITADLIAEGDEVAVHWTWTGTHTGEFMGIPPTGRQIAITGISIHRFANGEFVESWVSYDMLGMMQQLTVQTIPEGLVVDQITSPSLEGNLLGDPATREVIVYLPPSYDQGGNFPVVYLLHGYTGNARTFASNAYTGLYWPAESDFPEGGIYSLLDDLIIAGELKEMIVVMPDASNMYGGSWYTNSELTGNYEDYIVEDLVGYIDSNYRTLPSRDSRAIVGHSMGGYGAMKLAMKHPDVFGTVASHCGALYLDVLKALMPAAIEENPAGITGPAPDKPMTSVCFSMCAAFSPNLANPPFFVDLPFAYPSPEIIDEVWDRFMEHDVLTLLGTYGANVSSLRGIYMDVGAQDEFAANFQTDAFHQALEAAGIGHECEIYSGTHYDRVFERLTISLKFLSEALDD
ncbi:alpha/beta fold hydrolase [Planctomycetota bacterium]